MPLEFQPICPFFHFLQGANFLSLWQAVVAQGTLNGEVQEAHRAIEVQPKLHLKVKENVANTPIFSVKLQKSYLHL